MKLFLVLVLATVAICHPRRRGAATAALAYPSYNPIMDILADGENDVVDTKNVDVSETSYKAKKTSRTARKNKVFPQDLNQGPPGERCGPACMKIVPVATRQLFGEKKAPAP